MSDGQSNLNYSEPRPPAEELRDALPTGRCSIEPDDPSPEQIAIYRRMMPGRRLELAENLFWSARRMKAAWLKAQHPGWSEQQVESEVTRIFSHARS